MFGGDIVFDFAVNETCSEGDEVRFVEGSNPGGMRSGTKAAVVGFFVLGGVYGGES